MLHPVHLFGSDDSDLDSSDDKSVVMLEQDVDTSHAAMPLAIGSDNNDNNSVVTILCIVVP